MFADDTSVAHMGAQNI
jgi:hypothetical protein